MKKQHIDIASKMADDIIDLADIDLEVVSANACLIAAATFIVKGDLDAQTGSKLLSDYIAILKEEKEKEEEQK